jgi:hypothetical protein
MQCGVILDHPVSAHILLIGKQRSALGWVAWSGNHDPRRTLP